MSPSKSEHPDGSSDHLCSGSPVHNPLAPGPAGWLASPAEHRPRESRSSFVVMRRPEPDRPLRRPHRGPGGSALPPGLWVSWSCDVAPRWIETNTGSGTLQSAHEDRLLVSGEFVVGRVLQDRS